MLTSSVVSLYKVMKDCPVKCGGACPQQITQPTTLAACKLEKIQLTILPKSRNKVSILTFLQLIFQYEVLT